MNESDGSGVKSAERALTILELFGATGIALTFSEVADRLGYPRSSLHGLLRTLAARGWLDYDATTRRFSLGLRAWAAGVAYRPAVELARHATPVLDRLSATFGGTARIAMLDDGDSVDVADAAGVAGTRAAAHQTGAGKVLLAELDSGEVLHHLERVVQRGDIDAAGVERLHEVLDAVRSQGWAGDDGDESAALRSLAVPVRDRSGAVMAALEVTLPAFHVDAERRAETLRLLREGAAQISAAMGYTAIAV